jgi:2-hydroxy-6-oxonona-2,4-dienedioate hydrolase
VSELYAFRCGGGEPVVCVHGIGVTSTYFRPLARELAAAGRRVLVPDLPGWGRSPRPRRAFGVEELADALLAFMADEGVERAPLVANSFGCQVAVEAALRAPERVPALVLVGPTVDPYLRPLARTLLGFLVDSVREPPPLLLLIARDYLWMGIPRFVRTARAAWAHRIEERLPLVRVPVLVVRGARDGFVSQRWSEDAAKLVPRGRLAIVAGEAHACHYSAPRAVARLVLEELEQRGGEG